MSLTTKQIKNELDDTRARLRALRDEVRVKIHLAGLEARETWQKLDVESEKLVQQVGKASRGTLEAAVAELRRLSGSIDER